MHLFKTDADCFDARKKRRRFAASPGLRLKALVWEDLHRDVGRRKTVPALFHADDPMRSILAAAATDGDIKPLYIITLKKWK
jgi:hypothetical protein